MRRIIFLFCFLFLGHDYCDAQIITTIAGGGSGPDGSPATAANVHAPLQMTIDVFGNIYFTQGLTHRVRKVNTAGIITTVAGTGVSGFSGDGFAATAAKVFQPSGITTDTIGNVYFCDQGNSRIRKIDVSTGIITTVAGTGTAGYSGDGVPATAAPLNNPYGVHFRKPGELYISDNANRRVRKVDASGIITTVAGNGMVGGGGDGGPATSAQCGPVNVCFDSVGNMYISDGGTYRVRKVNTFGTITSIAGDSTAYIYTSDGIPATNAPIAPNYIAVDKYGVVYIPDGYNDRVRMVDASGIIHTIAGNGSTGYAGDGGSATSAQIEGPSSVALDACGNLYITQMDHPRIRKVTYSPILTYPIISLTGITSMPVGSTVTVNATVASAGSSYIIHWMNHGIEFTSTTVPVVTYTKMPGIDTITARIVPTSYGCYDSTTSTEHYVSTNTTDAGILSNQSFVIYPNPASTECTITYSGILSPHTNIAIHDLTGRLMHTYPLTGSSTTISIQNLPPGMYLCKIDADGHGVVSRKLVVMR